LPQLFPLAISIVAGVITTAGVVTILVALGTVIRDYFRAVRGTHHYPSFSYARARVGHGLVLALEFFVGADLLRTVLNPSFNDLISLSVIVILRTIISLSLDYELRQEKSPPVPPTARGPHGEAEAG
jgi:uncharacterized membrane protein